MKKTLVMIALVVAAVFLLNYRAEVKEQFGVLAKTPLPKAEKAITFSPILKPSSINLDIPFAPQAPHANWKLPYQEACEEAAIIMVHRYFTGETLYANTMDRELLKLVAWEKKTFGYYEHTTAEEMARILRDYFHHNAVVKYEFTLEDLKGEVASGNPVILPAAGRLLGNPYFRRPGPIYHALVVKGFTKDKIITNDPGTRRGKDYLYAPQVLMQAVHDWHSQDITKGRKAMIVVKSR